MAKWRLVSETIITILGALKNNTAITTLVIEDIRPDVMDRILTRASTSVEGGNRDNDLVDALSALLVENTSIERLSLEDVVRDDTKAGILARALSKRQNHLSSLDLGCLQTQITSVGIGHLFESVGGSCAFELGLPTHLWQDGIEESVRDPRLEYVLKENSAHISSLEIGGDDLDEACIEALRSNDKIKSLFFNLMLFENDKSWEALACGLSSNSSISKISFEDVLAISGHDLRFFVDELLRNKNRSMESLVFRNCQVCDIDGAQALSSLLIGHEALRHISIENDAFDDEGATTFARAIGENEISLESFRYVEHDEQYGFNSKRGVSSTSIAVLLVALLQSKVGIRSIYMNARSVDPDEGGTDLDLESIDAIANALKSNRTIEDFSYYGSDREGNMAVAVANALFVNRSLKSISAYPGLQGSASDNIVEQEMFLERKIYLPLEAALKVNHFVTDFGLWHDKHSEWGKKVSQLLSWNAKGELYATIMKGYQYPVHFTKDLPDSSTPEAIAQVDKKAQLNGIFSFIQRKQDAVFAGIGDSSEVDKKISGKRKSKG